MRVRLHGKRTRYMFGPVGTDTTNGCRCIPCTDANRDYQRSRRADLRRLNGTTGRFVDATEAREHLAFLTSRGVGDRAVAAATGLDRSTIQRVRQGRRSVHARTANRILAVSVARARRPRQLVPAGPPCQMIEEIVARGYTRTQVARMLGYRGRGIQCLRHDRITARRAEQIRFLHERLVVLDRTAGADRQQRYRQARAA